jgi:anti-sigma regulatory factor (Ser/Thr protein kinase)
MAGPSNRQQYLELSAHPNAAYHARRHVRRVLSQWGREDLVDTAELVASEFVANAVKATRDLDTCTEDEAIYGTTEYIWMNVYRSGEAVVLEVWDSSRTPPVQRRASLDEENGRGLQIVDALAKDWGYRWPRTGGKVLWCTLV